MIGDVGGWKRVRLILLEEFLVLLLGLDNPGLRWMFSDVDLHQGFDCSICELEVKIVTFHRR